MNYFYEINSYVAEKEGHPGRYVAIYDAHEASDAVIAGGFRLTSISDRIWKEKDGHVKFVKNRFSDIYDTHGYDVDMEEFMMVKLRAVTK